MKNIQEKVLKPIIIIALIFVLTIMDFLLLGNQIVSYAISESDKTNADNVLFSAYFVDEEENRNAYFEKNMMDKNIRLCLEIQIKNEGYFDGEIRINNGNFRLKEYEQSQYINSITDNSVILNRIEAENHVILSFGIEPIKEIEYELDFIDKVTNIQILGTYGTSARKNIKIDDSRDVQLLLKSPYLNTEDENALNLNAEIVTNKVYSINGENKRLVQVEVDSSLKGNQYPIKSTRIISNVIDQVEDVQVEKRGTYATNNDNGDLESSWNKEEGKFEVNILNKENDGKIQWNKNKSDKILITYILNDDISLIENVISINAQIELYDLDNTIISKDFVINKIIEKDGVINYEINGASELYKGNLYYGEDTVTESKSVIDIRYKDIAKVITVNEGEATYIGGNLENNANLVYTSTKVNKNNIIRILGDNGILEIKDIEGNVLATLTKDGAEKNEGEYVELSYATQRNIVLQLTNYENEGKVEFIHNKILREEIYTKQQMQSFEQLNVQGTIQADINIEDKKSSVVTQLKEPESYAKIMSNTDTLSTLQTNNNVEFNVILKTDDTKYDLYKNPSIEIEFPQEIVNINAKLNPVFIEGFEIQEANVYQNDNGNKVARLQLSGNQMGHSNNVSEGIILNVNANIDVDKTIASKDSEIVLRYTNENAGKNVYEQILPIKLQSKEGLLIYNNAEGFNAKGEVFDTVDSESVYGMLEAEDIARNLSGTVVLVNNYEKDLNNVTIIGKNLGDSNLKLDLSNNIEVNGANAKVLYSENEEDWTEDINSVENVNAYKIELENIETSGAVSFDYNFAIPENVGYDKIAKVEQDVMYTYEGQNLNNVFNVQLKTEGEKLPPHDISIESGATSDITGELEVTTKTMLGDKELNEQDSVYEGGTLKNVVTIANKTDKDLTNVKVSVTQENAVIYDLVGEERVNESISDEKVIEHVYKEWDTNTKEFETINKIKSGEIVNLTYQVVINEVQGNDKTTYGAITIEADGINTVNKNTIRTNIEQGDIKLITKYCYTEELQVYTQQVLPIEFDIKNIKGQDLNNVKVKLKLTEDLKVNGIETINFYYENFDDIEEGKITDVSYDRQNNIVSFNISKLLTNDSLIIVVNPIVQQIPLNESSKEILVSSSATIENGKEYVSNIANRTVKQVVKNINIEQSTDKENEEYKHEDTFNIIINVNNNTNNEADVVVTDQLNEVFVINNAIKVNGAKITDISNDIVDGDLMVLDKVSANSSMKIQINVTIDATKVINGESIKNIVTLEYDGVTSTNEMEFNIEKESDIDDSKDNPYDKPTNPDDPDNPDNPDDPNNPDNPDDPNKPVNPDDPDNPSKNTFLISGVAWLDENKNGRRETSEKLMSGIQVRLIDETTGEFVKNSSGNIMTQTTNNNGEYSFSVKQGDYIVIFLYDTNEYNVTEYQKDGVIDSNNSDFITKTVTIDGKEIDVGITDKIQITSENIENIDIGLVKKQIFDMKLDKYVSKIVVQNAQGTKTYQYDNQQLAKVEIRSKYYKGSTVVVEYKIKVTNEGEIAGYANEIIDYLPSGFKFSSELNKDWYVGSDNNLHSISLSNEKIATGETKELTVILTKTLEQNGGGLITNTAEIYKSSNDQNISDTDSIAGNKANGEDDISTASVIISVSTGAIKICMAVIFVILVLIGIALYIIKKKGGRIDWKKLKVEF